MVSSVGRSTGDVGSKCVGKKMLSRMKIGYVDVY